MTIGGGDDIEDDDDDYYDNDAEMDYGDDPGHYIELLKCSGYISKK